MSTEQPTVVTLDLGQQVIRLGQLADQIRSDLGRFFSAA